MCRCCDLVVAPEQRMSPLLPTSVLGVFIVKKSCLTAVLLVLFLGVFATACDTVPPGYHLVDLTRDQGDIYDYTVSPGSLSVNGVPANKGGNTRVILWEQSAVASWNQQVCASFSDTGGMVQEGVVLRIADSATFGGTKAITVMKNIFMKSNHIFNVHLWDSAQANGGINQIGWFDMSSTTRVPGTNPVRPLLPQPWRMCARVIGDQLSVKVWSLTLPEPAWSGPGGAQTMTLPAAAVYPGKMGMYAGHVEAGHAAWFTDIVNTPL